MGIDASCGWMRRKRVDGELENCCLWGYRRATVMTLSTATVVEFMSNRV